MQTGPQPFTREERLQRALDIADKFRAKFGEDVRAIGTYGSLGRGTDGPYSDIEMFCIVRGEGIDTTYEWCEGSWKAEVNVNSADVLFDWARELAENWSQTHGCVMQVHAFYDPEGIFPHLKELIFAHEAHEFDAVIAQFIVDDVFELIGKIRNAIYEENHAALPNLIMTLAKAGAYSIGLANRHLYTTSSKMLMESLSLPNRPMGYDDLCQLVMGGDLSSLAINASLADAFWNGIESWSKAKRLKIYKTLDELLMEGQNKNG